MEKTLILKPEKPQIVDMNGNVLTVERKDGAKLQLNNAFVSAKNVTAACFSIQQTVLNQLSPEPEWYKGLNDKFKDVKGLAGTWLNDYAVAVTSTIPSSVMNYTPVFTACSKVITDTIKNSGYTLDEENIRVISNILKKMIDQVKSIQGKVSTYVYTDKDGKSKGKLIDWQTDMGNASNDLKKGTDTVQKAAADLSDKIQDLTDQISELRKDIEYYNILVSTGAGMVGGGAFVTTVGGSLCLAFPVIGGICMFFGIGSVIAGASLWGVYQNKINAANKKIRENLSSIKEDEKALTAINALAQSCTSVVTYADQAVRNLSDFSVSWNIMGDTLLEILHHLNSADDSVKESCIDILVEMGAAGDQWRDVKKYAEDLLALSSNNVEVVDINKLSGAA